MRGMPAAVHSCARIDAPAAFAARQASTSFSASATRTKPAALMTAQGSWWSRAARTEPCSRMRSEEHTSELQSLMRISYAVFCLKKKETYKYKQILDN